VIREQKNKDIEKASRRRKKRKDRLFIDRGHARAPDTDLKELGSRGRFCPIKKKGTAEPHSSIRRGKGRLLWSHSYGKKGGKKTSRAQKSERGGAVKSGGGGGGKKGEGMYFLGEKHSGYKGNIRIEVKNESVAVQAWVLPKDGTVFPRIDAQSEENELISGLVRAEEGGEANSDEGN